MVTGASVAALRRHIKFASVFYDRVQLEAGSVDIVAGPTAAACMRLSPYNGGRKARWQTPRERGAAQRAPFTIGFGREEVPGVPATHIDTVAVSDTTIHWVATFHPFERELPTGCDWIVYGSLQSEDPQQTQDLAKHWAAIDAFNPALMSTIPVKFARNLIIENANLDLAVISAAEQRTSAAFEPLHMDVVARRLAGDSGWRMTGFSVPILLPRVGNLSWEAIADLRRNRHIKRLRSVLQDIEDSSLAEAQSGDVESATRHAFEQYQVHAVGAAKSIARIVGGAAVSMVISTGVGISTMALSPAVAISASAGVAATQSVASGTAAAYQEQRRNGWLTLAQQLR